MAMPIARTRDEAHLYLDLHPCAKCGSIDVTWDCALVEADGELARAYFGKCPACGVEREYVFGVPEHPVIVPEFPNFGGPEPSQLLDAGEWLWVSDMTASRAPADDPQAERQALTVAARAVEEVVKFLPAGAQQVPYVAFWSERGQEIRAAEPGRFARDRLVVVRDTYQRMSIEGVHGDRQ